MAVKRSRVVIAMDFTQTFETPTTLRPHVFRQAPVADPLPSLSHRSPFSGGGVFKMTDNSSYSFN